MDLTVIRGGTDAAVERAVGGRPVSCKAGCSACCHQLVSTTLAEAADLVARYPELVRAARPELERQSRALMREASPAAFFGTPCVFLGPEGLCSVYPHRPIVCRTHMVSSSSELCASPSSKVRKYALAQIALQASEDVQAGTAQPKSFAPIPIAVLLALWASEPLSGDNG